MHTHIWDTDEEKSEIVKVLSPLVNLPNILREVFSSIFFRQIIQAQTVSREKLRKKHFRTKKLLAKFS